MANTQSTLELGLLHRLRALKDAHPQCSALVIEIMAADQKTITTTAEVEGPKTLVVRARCSSDFLEAFECQGFQTLLLDFEVNISDLLNLGDQFWDRFCSALKNYPAGAIYLGLLCGLPSEAQIKELMLDRPSYGLLGRFNSLVEAALANKSAEFLGLVSRCSNTDLDNVYLHESSTSSSSGYSAFQALLAPGNVSATRDLCLWRWPLTAHDVKILASDSPALRSLQIARLHQSPAMTKKLVTLLSALETNRTLRQLAIEESPASDVPEVYNATIGLLERNPGTLRDVVLVCSEFELDERNADLRQRVDAVQQQRKKDGARWSLRSFPKVKPTSIRIFFCGHPFAGKTTLRRTMAKVLHQNSMLRDIFGSKMARSSPRRTSGIEVTHVNHGGLEISFWDLAGQKEFHAWHDVFMPNEPGPSLFLLVCSLVSNNNGTTNAAVSCKSGDDLSSEVKYWLRYISSNTCSKDNSFPGKAHVLLVFTHLDKLVEPGIRAAAIARGNSLKDEMRRSFETVASVQETAFFVDSHNVRTVANVAMTVVSESKTICSSCEDVYKVCDDAKKVIADLIIKGQVWITRAELKSSLTSSVIYGNTDIDRGVTPLIAAAVLDDLHQTGSIVHFKECDIVLLNLQWFCRDFMGGILDKTTQTSKTLQYNSHNGFWETGEMIAVLESLLYPNETGEMIAVLESLLYPNEMLSKGETAWYKKLFIRKSTGLKLALQERKSFIEQLIIIMKQLEICFEIEKDGKRGIFIPAALKEKEERTLRRWTANMLSGASLGDFDFVGRRLMCKDEERTFLTPGIFPRLQVHLRNVLQTACYNLEKDLIKSVEDCMEVVIEFNETPLTFIDIMVRFHARSKPQDEAFELIKKVVCGVADLQRESGCWRGVELVEAALRPSCVERLIPPEYKAKEFAMLESLRQATIRRADAIANFESITHTWGPVEAVSLHEECVPVINLLGKRAFSDIVKEQILQVEELSKNLGIGKVPMQDNMNSTDHASSSQSIASHDDPHASSSLAITSGGNVFKGPGCFGRAKSMLTERDAYMYTQLESIATTVSNTHATVGGIATTVSSTHATVGDIWRGTKTMMEMLDDQRVRLLPEIKKILEVLYMTSSTEHASDVPKFFLFEEETARRFICKLVPGVVKYRLRFLCESEPILPHPPKDGCGMEVTLLEEGSVISSVMPFMQTLLSVLAVGFRVGAPLAQSQGIPIPDVSTLIEQLVQESRKVQVRDSSVVHDMAGPNYKQQARKARAWVKELLQQHMCYGDDQKMYNLFGLRKQLLPDGRWVWRCDQH